MWAGLPRFLADIMGNLSTLQETTRRTLIVDKNAPPHPPSAPKLSRIRLIRIRD